MALKLICDQCGREVWTFRRWAEDAQANGGEWSRPAHQEWLRENVCRCAVPRRLAAAVMRAKEAGKWWN